MRPSLSSDVRVKQHDATAEITLNLAIAQLLGTVSNKLDEIFNFISKTHEVTPARKAIGLRDVILLTGLSRSQIYAMTGRTNDLVPFPRPFHLGKSTRWWAHEVQAWIDAQAAASQVAH